MNTYNPSLPELTKVKLAACLINQSIQQHYTIKQLARKFKLSEQSLKVVFRQEYGMGPHGYLKKMRMDKAKEMLLTGVTNKVVMAAIGYENETTFCRAFKLFYGESPAVWKNRKRNNVNYTRDQISSHLVF